MILLRKDTECLQGLLGIFQIQLNIQRLCTIYRLKNLIGQLYFLCNFHSGHKQHSLHFFLLYRRFHAITTSFSQK